MSKFFKVWIDGNAEENRMETDFGIIEAENMNDAIDKAAVMAGYIDHADIAQELGWEESRFNIEETTVVMLMNPHTGTVQSTADWADDGYTSENAELVEVVRDENGDWVEA